MTEPCCPKPKATIIKLGTFEAGILGLEEIFKGALASGNNDDQSLVRELVAAARQHGNYIAPRVEALYEAALLREYRLYCTNRK